jgi:hypothetical protein
MELILPSFRSTYLGEGFPSLGESVQLLVIHVPAAELLKLERSSKVMHLTPEAFIMQLENVLSEILVSKDIINLIFANI